MFIAEKELKDFIADSGLVSKKDIAEAEEEAKTRKVSVGEVLVNRGKLSEDDLRKMQGRVLGTHFVDLKNRQIPFSILSLVPEPIARGRNIVAFNRTDEAIEVAALDILDVSALDFLAKNTGLKIHARLTSGDSMKSVLLQYQRGLKAEFGETLKRETAALKELSDDVSALRVTDTLLRHALIHGASDIHVEPLEKELLIRYRIDGGLHDAMVLPKEIAVSVTRRIKALSGSGRFKVEMNGEQVSLRVSFCPTSHGERIVLRVMRDVGSKMTLEQAGFHGESLERIHSAIKKAKGMILVAGPADSGRSTTIYALVDLMNSPRVNISSVEDPIEYQMPRVNQVQVRPDIGLSMAQGLRTVLRQDPDVIMVGDIEDSEVAALSAHAALSGRAVIASITGPSASSALSRFAVLSNDLLAASSTVSLVIGQRLARRLSDSKERKALSRAELGALSKVVDLDKMLSILRSERVIGQKDGWDRVAFGSPVKNADDEGYAGHICLQETLVISPAIQSLIMKGAKPSEIETQAKREGMTTMLEDGIFKAAQGFTSIEEVLRVLSR